MNVDWYVLLLSNRSPHTNYITLAKLNCAVARYVDIVELPEETVGFVNGKSRMMLSKVTPINWQCVYIYIIYVCIYIYICI